MNIRLYLGGLPFRFMCLTLQSWLEYCVGLKCFTPLSSSMSLNWFMRASRGTRARSRAAFSSASTATSFTASGSFTSSFLKKREEDECKTKNFKIVLFFLFVLLVRNGLKLKRIYFLLIKICKSKLLVVN